MTTSSARPSVAARTRTSMRPPMTRPSTARSLAPGATTTGRTSPAESIASIASAATVKPSSPPPSQLSNNGTKRKERDFEQEGGEETNINVVVRCRGRNDREVRENSGVVVSTNGVKGNNVELSMGPSALSNKSYNFDKVFSPAADQTMIYEEVVVPILDEVLAGFNCTIFAYGQTGTGKTYTMSGDITETLPLPDGAGIIPRVLYGLFQKLEGQEDAETSVKCSFIELYNEELRDLLSVDETIKLKIYEDTKKGQTSTLVQGMEECHIKTASKGLQLLRAGTNKRQVAATKCNDLSSRSHSVFTITVYTRRTSETGEDFVSAGKLNLVDLAGSENIQRSGAENKRAAEAGLINKSLLTLGRVINALVDRGSHIPYRESKLTRLLQDSLGGRTKTCIVATLSPAKSNLEETISTLDYAFRAKNIRNKPQLNQVVSKKTLLREFTAEIEKLKSELMAARSRNGVYLTQESFEQMNEESESRRILNEEQKEKMDTMEANLRNKAQELFSLTSTFNDIKKDNEAVRVKLEGTSSALEKTEIVLMHVRQSLAEETVLRKAHQSTEASLHQVSQQLISTVQQASADAQGLQAKLRRRSDLHEANKTNWVASQGRVAKTTTTVEQRMLEFENQHHALLTALSQRMEGFVQDELKQLSHSKAFLDKNAAAFAQSESEVSEQTGHARDEMNKVLEEIKTLRGDVKEKVGQGLDSLSAAAQRISAGVVQELETFHTQLHSSYVSLGREFKSTFDDLAKRLGEQRREAETLKTQFCEAGQALTIANDKASARLSAVLKEEKERAADERTTLLSQITTLVQGYGDTQDKRVEAKVASIQEEIKQSNVVYGRQEESYSKTMDTWSEKEQLLVEDMLKARENVKNKIKHDWTAANDQNVTIQTTTKSVHEETVRIVDAQMKQMDVQLQALDDILARVKTQNGLHHEAHVQSLASLAETVRQSYSNIGTHFVDSSARAQHLQQDVSKQSSALAECLLPLQTNVHAPLADLRTKIEDTKVAEYKPTGATPHKLQYQVPSDLPRTAEHEVILAKYRNQGPSPTPGATPRSTPSKSSIFTDAADVVNLSTESAQSTPAPPDLKRKSSRPNSALGGLKEVDVNVAASGVPGGSNSETSRTTKEPSQQRPLKRQNTGTMRMLNTAGADSRDFSASMGPGSKLPKKAIAEGRENIPFGASVGPREGRSLRNRTS